MAPSRQAGIRIIFASKPSSVIFVFNINDNSNLARNIMVIDIRNGKCLVGGSSAARDSHVYFDEINNELTVSSNDDGIASFDSKAIVIPLYSTHLA